MTTKSVIAFKRWDRLAGIERHGIPAYAVGSKKFTEYRGMVASDMLQDEKAHMTPWVALR